MTDVELASSKLMIMVNDVEGQPLFEPGGPLGWFSLKKTYASGFMKGHLTEKQTRLIMSVYDQYVRLRRVSHGFVKTGHARTLAAILYEVLHEKPKVTTSEDRSRSQRLSRIVRAFRGETLLHIGHFNEAESLIGELSDENKVSIWEQIHSARRAYLQVLYG
jgi:hypothetical protein